MKIIPSITISIRYFQHLNEIFIIKIDGEIESLSDKIHKIVDDLNYHIYSREQIFIPAVGIKEVGFSNTDWIILYLTMSIASICGVVTDIRIES